MTDELKNNLKHRFHRSLVILGLATSGMGLAGFGMLHNDMSLRLTALMIVLIALTMSLYFRHADKQLDKLEGNP